MLNIVKKFWKPSVCGNFQICPIPFKLDTYRGCSYGCKYCFARDSTQFARRNSEHTTFNYLEGNDYEKLDKWIQRILKKEYNYNNASEVAFKERLPLKIGVMADPFPYIENNEKITYNILKVLDKYDYPVQMSTKNPQILADYYKNFNNPNWVIAVTIISIDDNFVKNIEVNAPSTEDRFKAIKQLTDMGAKVIVRIQPAIYPKIMNELPELINKIKENGAFGFVMEGLKIRVCMSKQEQQLFKQISLVLGYDIRQWYKENGTMKKPDYNLSKVHKLDYIQSAQDLANKNNLKCFIGDNDVCYKSCSGECCGTEMLRNYKILNNKRISCFQNEQNKFSLELEKSIVNFVRDNKGWKGKTIKEVIYG